MHSLVQDLRHAARILLKSRGFTAIAVFTMALGIGANSAIFSIVNSVLLRAFPYPKPENLVMLWGKRIDGGRNVVSPPNFEDWRDQSRSFQGMAATTGSAFILTGVDVPERIPGLSVSASFFDVLGVQPALGRAFRKGEDKREAPRVAVLSHGLWEKRFGADPAIVGRAVVLDGEPCTIVGVMPKGFQFRSSTPQLWAPLLYDFQIQNREYHYLSVLGRLKEGVSLQQATSEMDTIGARLAQEYPKSNTKLGVEIVPLREQVVGDIRRALLVLLGSVGCLLLIACANVANLLLTRATGRQREIAIRTALGASRLRVLRQLLIESALLSLTGGALGLLLAQWALEALVALRPGNLPRIDEISIDLPVLGFTAGIALLTGLIFGLAPALRISLVDVSRSLKEGGRGASSGREKHRLRGLLVVTEMALAVLLLAGAGLMIRSFVHLLRAEPGFRREGLLTMGLSLPQSRYPKPEQRQAFYREIHGRIQGVPGVSAASLAFTLPAGGWNIGMPFRIEASDGRYAANYVAVTPEYFHTIGLPLLKGRAFTDRDTPGSPPVVIVGQTLARALWPNEDPIGKRIIMTPPSGAKSREVVGVVSDARRPGATDFETRAFYVPYPQDPLSSANVVVRTGAADPMALAASVQKAIQSVDPDQAVSNVRTLEQMLSDSLARPRFNALLLGVFGALALVLAAVGIFSVMSYSVSQRTHEFGVRMALGARNRDVLRLVLAHGLRLAVAGVAIGVAAALALTHLMKTLLFGVVATDPATFAGVAVLLSAVALAACYFPARRATHVDPITALRHE